MARDNLESDVLSVETVAPSGVQPAAPVNFSMSAKIQQPWPEAAPQADQDPVWVEKLVRMTAIGDDGLTEVNVSLLKDVFDNVMRGYTRPQKQTMEINLERIERALDLDGDNHSLGNQLLMKLAMNVYNAQVTGQPGFMQTDMGGITLDQALTGTAIELSAPYGEKLKTIALRAPDTANHAGLVVDFAETMIKDNQYRFADAVADHPDVNDVGSLLQKIYDSLASSDPVAESSITALGMALPPQLQLSYFQGVAMMLMTRPADLSAPFKNSTRSMADIMASMPASMTRDGVLVNALEARPEYVQTVERYVTPVETAAPEAVAEEEPVDTARLTANVIVAALDKSRNSKRAVLNKPRNGAEAWTQFWDKFNGTSAELSLDPAVLKSKISEALSTQVVEAWKLKPGMNEVQATSDAYNHKPAIASRIEAITNGIDDKSYLVAVLQGFLLNITDSTKGALAFFDTLLTLPEKPLSDPSVMNMVRAERNGEGAFNAPVWALHNAPAKPKNEPLSVRIKQGLANAIAAAFPQPRETSMGLNFAAMDREFIMSEAELYATEQVVEAPDHEDDDLEIPAFLRAPKTGVVGRIDDTVVPELEPNVTKTTGPVRLPEEMAMALPPQPALVPALKEDRGIVQDPVKHITFGQWVAKGLDAFEDWVDDIRDTLGAVRIATVKSAGEKSERFGVVTGTLMEAAAVRAAVVKEAAVAGVKAMQQSAAERHTAEAPMRAEFAAKAAARREAIGVKAHDLGVQLRKGTLDFKEKADDLSRAAYVKGLAGAGIAIAATASTAKAAWAAIPGKERVANGAKAAWNHIPAEARPMAASLALAIVGLGSVAVMTMIAVANHHAAPGNSDILMTAASGLGSAVKTGAENSSVISEIADVVQQAANSDVAATVVTHTATVAHKVAQHSDVVQHVATALPVDATPVDMIQQVSHADSGNGVVKLMNVMNANGQSELATQFVECAQKADDVCKADVVQRAGLGDLLKSIYSAAPKIG